MRQTKIFAGSSHPTLAEAICNRLGSPLDSAQLGKFANGETRVQINTSVRDQDVFIVQSGCQKINDAVMELLIMISAAVSGSAKSVTAVMPYFPYSRQSKKKSHRGSITARMLANLLHIAGVTHIITLDLHASQMQGFFHCPVDNLVAEPLLAYWIKHNIPEWKKSVVVSKNPGGTKRVTSLADALKVSFGIVMTDRRRPGKPNSHDSMNTSVILERLDTHTQTTPPRDQTKTNGSPTGSSPTSATFPRRQINGQANPSPLKNMETALESLNLTQMNNSTRALSHPYEGSDDDEDDEDGDDSGREPTSRDVVTGRLMHGHIIDDDAESPPFSSASSHIGGYDADHIPDHMLSSQISITSTRAEHRHGLGGSADAGDSSDEEEEHLKNPEQESTVTLVGNVRGKPVVIVDDMIDKSTSWIAAAETVVKRGGATKVYCMATHGIFGGDSLRELAACDYIEAVIVTNSLPLAPEKIEGIPKLVQLDVAPLLAESIRRNKHGEALSQLFLHYD